VRKTFPASILLFCFFLKARAAFLRIYWTSVDHIPTVDFADRVGSFEHDLGGVLPPSPTWTAFTP
jgi:hypothetical protein